MQRYDGGGHILNAQTVPVNLINLRVDRKSQAAAGRLQDRRTLKNRGINAQAHSNHSLSQFVELVI
jgi:hypothetical protein